MKLTLREFALLYKAMAQFRDRRIKALDRSVTIDQTDKEIELAELNQIQQGFDMLWREAPGDVRVFEIRRVERE